MMIVLLNMIKIEIKKNQSYEADSFSFNKESSKARIIKIKPRRTYFLYIFYLICMMIFAIFSDFTENKC